MKKSKPTYSGAFFFSLILHGLIIGLLVYGFAKTVETVAPEAVPEVMKATALDESQIDAEVQKLQDREKLKKSQEEDRQTKLEQRRKQEENRLTELRKKHQIEEQRAKEQEKQRLEKQSKEKQRLAELKKQQEEEQERLSAIKEKKEKAEKKRREEELRLAKLEEQKKKEKARQEAEKKAAAEKAAKEKQQLAAEQRKQALAARRESEHQKQVQSAVAGAIGIIRQKVQRRWIRPASSQSGLSCIIRVKLIPGGEVVDAVVVKSSGVAAFDRSAERAVLKSSPLPLPADRTLFSHFRNFEFNFNPS